jgi:hypothetical protein
MGQVSLRLDDLAQAEPAGGFPAEEIVRRPLQAEIAAHAELPKGAPERDGSGSLPVKEQ